MAKSTLNQLLTRLRRLRERHGLTQEAFAELSGITYKYYQQIEAGRKRDLRLSTLERLAAAYGIQTYQLLSPKLTRTRIVTKKRTASARSRG